MILLSYDCNALISDESAKKTIPCEKGHARGDSFFKEGARYTECRKCNWKMGKYQDESGRAKCKDVSEGHVVGTWTINLLNTII